MVGRHGIRRHHGEALRGRADGVHQAVDVGGRRGGDDPGQIQLGRVRRCQLPGPQRGMTALGQAPHEVALAGTQFHLAHGSHDVEAAATLALADQVRVDAGRAQALVVGGRNDVTRGGNRHRDLRADRMRRRRRADVGDTGGAVGPRDDRRARRHAGRSEDQSAHLHQVAAHAGREVGDAPAVEIAGVDRLGLQQIARGRFGRRRLGRCRRRLLGGCRRLCGGGDSRRSGGCGRLSGRRGGGFGGGGGRGRIRFGVAAGDSNQRQRCKRHEETVHLRTL